MLTSKPSSFRPGQLERLLCFFSRSLGTVSTALLMVLLGVEQASFLRHPHPLRHPLRHPHRLQHPHPPRRPRRRPHPRPRRRPHPAQHPQAKGSDWSSGSPPSTASPSPSSSTIPRIPTTTQGSLGQAEPAPSCRGPSTCRCAQERGCSLPSTSCWTRPLPPLWCAIPWRLACSMCRAACR